MAALVSLIGVPFMLSTTATALASSLYRKIAAMLFPALGRCERITWQDLSDGVLHTCLPVRDPCIMCRQPCLHVKHHKYLRVCPHTSIPTFFTRSHGNFVPKPRQLDLLEDYILVDMAALEIFAMYFLHLFPHLTDENKIKFQKIGGIMTAYLTTEREQMSYLVSPITKNEAAKILDGYPPCYREGIRTHSGDIIPNPIKDRRDVDRGGWIVGVGMDSLILELGFHEQSFPPWSRVQCSYAAIEHARGFRRFPRAMQRVFIGLCNIKKAFPREDCVDWAIKLARRLVQESRSGMIPPMHESKLFDGIFGFSSYREGRGWSRGRPDEDGLSSLTGNQCVLAINIFNKYEGLTVYEAGELEACLLPVLRCALIGFFMVKSWIEDNIMFPRSALSLPIDEDFTHVFFRIRTGNVWK